MACIAYASALLCCMACSTTTNDEPEPGETATENGQTVEGIDTPNEQTEETFENMYGSNVVADWKLFKDEYYVAEFGGASNETTAWFNKQGECVLEDAPAPTNEVLPIVSEALTTTKYADWKVTDAATLTQKELSKEYTLEMTNDSIESELYFSRQGDFVKAIDDAENHIDTPAIVPEKIAQLIDTLYNAPEVVDISANKSLSSVISVGLLDNSIYKIASFSNAYDWISTLWNIDKSDLPAAVWDGFVNSEYSQHQLLSIREQTTPEDITYVFYLADNIHKIMAVSFNANGTPTHSISVP